MKSGLNALPSSLFYKIPERFEFLRRNIDPAKKNCLSMLLGKSHSPM